MSRPRLTVVRGDTLALTVQVPGPADPGDRVLFTAKRAVDVAAVDASDALAVLAVEAAPGEETTADGQTTTEYVLTASLAGAPIGAFVAEVCHVSTTGTVTYDPLELVIRPDVTQRAPA